MHVFGKKQKLINEAKCVKSTITEELKEIILAITEGREVKIQSDFMDDKELAKMLQNLADKNCNRKQELIALNNLLNNIVQMVEVKDMVDGINQQSTTLQSMSTNSEELTASVEDVANMTQTAASMAENAYNISKKGTQSISEAMEFVKRSFDEVSAVNNKMIEVKQKTETINDIVDIIKGVADQTNLLALNAAIEAARAGDSGRGFAVVADEVRKLAEHTRHSVDSIQQNVSQLQQAIDTSVSSIDSTTGQLNSGTKLVDEAMKSIAEIGSSVMELSEIVTQVSANTEEQTAAIQSFSSGTVEIADNAQVIVNKSNNIGLKIFDLSKNIDAIRGEMVNQSNCLSQAEKIEVYKVDHLLWRWKVYNMLLHYEVVDAGKVGNYNECRLGKWYYGIECENLKKIPAFNYMEKPHIALHQAAKKSVEAYQRKDMEAANKYLLEMDKYSKEVFTYLDEIKKILDKN